MKISATPFSCTYHHSTKAGNHLHGKYVLHHIDVYNEIIIGDVVLQAVYQSGISYQYNDFSCPNPELELSEAGGTDKTLIKINELYESDFDDEELISEKLEGINELCPIIDNVEKLFQLYVALNDNKPDLSDFLDPEKYTDNYEDYVEDESTGVLTLKDKLTLEEHHD